MKNLVRKAAAASSAKKDATPVAAASAKKEGVPAAASAKRTAGKAVAGAKGKKKKIGSQDMVLCNSCTSGWSSFFSNHYAWI